MRLFPAAYCRLSCAAERYVRERFNAVVACVVFLFDFKNLFVYTHNQTSFGVSQSQFLSLIVSLFCVIFPLCPSLYGLVWVSLSLSGRGQDR